MGICKKTFNKIRLADADNHSLRNAETTPILLLFTLTH